MNTAKSKMKTTWQLLNVGAVQVYCDKKTSSWLKKCSLPNTAWCFRFSRLTNSSLEGSIYESRAKGIKIAKKGYIFVDAAYLPVKSNSFSYDKKDTGQFIYWFTDNSTVREECKRQFYWGLMHGINHYSQKGHKLHRNS